MYDSLEVTPGRKAKDRQILLLERHLLALEAHRIVIHPFQLLYKWMQVRKQWKGVYIFALRDEGRTPTRSDQAARLTRAFRATAYDSDRALRITSHVIQARAASCAFYSAVHIHSLKHRADWSQSRLVFERDYLDVSYNATEEVHFGLSI